MTDVTDPLAVMCHYTRADTAFSKILPSGKLLMNPYFKMRDPFENKHPAFGAVGRGGPEDREATSKKLSTVYREIRRWRNQQCLLSLTEGDDRQGSATEQPFRCAWARARMWEQYADNHAGVCLVFDRAVLLDSLQHNLGADGAYWEGPVKYTVAGFAASRARNINLDKFHERSLEDDVAEHVLEHHEEFFLLKTEDWASEFEYRFVFQPASDRKLTLPIRFVSYGNALRSVVVGERFPEWQLPSARAIARDARVVLRRMTWKDSRPYLMSA